MNLIRLCIARPVGVSVGVLLTVLFGLLSLFAIPVQLTPNVDTTVVTVSTSWPGAQPREIEREIIDKQEEQLRSVQGLQKMTSQSVDNAGTITLEFYPRVTKDEALREVNEKLRQVSNYPLEVDEPTVQAADAAVDNPIAWLILFPTDESTEVPKLRDFAEDFIKPYLDRVPGVASTDIFGGRRREVRVNIEPAELAARGITFSDVARALQRQNENISAGTRAQGKRDFSIRTIGKYQSMEDILDTVIADTDGGPVYVRDVGTAELGHEKERGFVRSKGDFVLAFPVRREVGTNVLEVMAGLKDAIRRVNQEVIQARKLPLELRQVYDESVYINESIDMVTTNIVYGGALAIIVLFLFLRNWRATAVVALSIPVAVIGTFLVVTASGRTINVISLAGIAFAVGMVVDNAVVVLENIFRHKEMGKDTLRAALDGSAEVWGAVLASTLTTMAVFVPVIFVEEEAGQLFRDISVATVAAVGLSLLVSLTVIPTLAGRLLARAKLKTTDADNAETSGFAARVAGIVSLANTNYLTRIVTIIVMTGASLFGAYWFVPESTYLPAGNRNLVFGFLVTPPGYSVDEFKRMAAIIEETIAPYWEAEEGSPEKDELDRRWVQNIQAQIDADALPELQNEDLTPLERDRIRREWLTPPPVVEHFFYVARSGGVFMGARSADPAVVKPLARLLTTAGRRIPGVFAIFNQSTLFRFSGNSAEVQVRGDDLDQVVAAASAMFGELSTKFGRPRTDPQNFNLGRPELQIFPDRERAAELGLDVTDVGFIVEACGDGAFVGEYRKAGGDAVDIRLFVAGQRERTTQEIGEVPIATPNAGIVPLLSAVRLVETAALEQITRVERQRAVTLTVTPPEATPLEQVTDTIKNQIEPQLRESGAISPNILVSMTGNASKLQQAREAMVGEWHGLTSLDTYVSLISSRFFLSILIVYLLMAALFESWLYPFVIMFSVPLALFGGVLGLFIAHKATLLTTFQPIQQLDVLTFLGFVILVGIVVNNAILIVHQTLHFMREDNYEPQRAIREAVRVRVRPIFMTSLTTFFGQLPLALFPGAGSELYRGLASIMLGGLIVATVGTLILVPTALGFVTSIRAAVGAALSGSPSATPASGALRDRG